MVKQFTLTTFVLFIASLLLSSNSWSQCSPSGHNWGSSNFGISPDPQLNQNVNSGTVGEAYSQVMYLKCPSSIGNVIPDSPFASLSIDSLRLNDVQIMMDGEYVSINEMGLDITCNNGTCNFLPAQTYCGDITGTPTVSGTWPLALQVTVYFYYNSHLSVQHHFEGYELVIEPAPAQANVNVTFQVNMQDQTVSADGVHVAGNFNDWSTTATPMTDEDGNGIYEVTVSVPSNQQLQYKFLNGNAWGADESVPEVCATDNNRTYSIGTEDAVIFPVCYGSCDACMPIVEPTMVNVTFLVNMNGQTVSPNGVHIAGSFQGWNPSGSPMTDSNGDGIYELTAEVDAYTVIQFKFLNGNNWGDGIQEIVPGACGVDDNSGGFNRSMEVLGSDMTYGPVCYSSCENCATVENIQLTLRVDMSNVVIAPSGVYVAGTFNGWNPSATVMTEYEPGRYQATVTAAANTQHQYKFLSGTDWAGVEQVPSECGVDDNNGAYNREFSTSTTDAIAPLVWFSSCAVCESNETVNITFQVDMQNQTVSSNGVYLAGSFNGFSSTATPMTLSTGSIYTATVSVSANTALQYKFINGNDFSGVETVPFACGIDDGFGGYNRHFTTAHTDVEMPAVCFSECGACTTINIDALNANTVRIYPNPANEQVVIEGTTALAEYSIYNGQGQLMASQKMASTERLQIDTRSWSAGVYYLVVPGMNSIRFAVQH